MTDIRTLCYRCQQNYIDSGYKLITWHQDIMQPCGICRSPGFDVEIIEKDGPIQDRPCQT